MCTEIIEDIEDEHSSRPRGLSCATDMRACRSCGVCVEERRWCCRDGEICWWSCRVDKRVKSVSKDGVDGAASKTGGDASTKGGGAAAESYTYYLHPEYKLPEDVTDASTEADAPGTRLWRWYGDESMYPFWAVERATDAWVQKTNTESKDGVQLEFNVERKEMTFNCVTVGAVQGSSVAITVNVRLPVLTNTHDMTAGTRLLMEKAANTNAENRKAETWKTHVGAAAKAQKQESSAKSKAQAKTKATQKGGASTLCVNI